MGTGRLKNEIGNVISPSEILYRCRKYTQLGVKTAKLGPQSTKTKFGTQNQYGRVIYPSIGNFKWSKKKYSFEGQKCENKLLEPKTEFGAQNQYSRGIYPSIENITWSKKNIKLGVKKTTKGPQRPKNGIWSPKSVWSCDKSIDREFDMK
jgi:hypothetical protein